MDSPTATSTAAAIEVVKQIPDTLAKVIDTLSIKLGSTGEALFKILVRQQYVVGLQNIFDIAVFTIILYIWWKILYKKATDMVSGDGPGVITVIATIITAILVIIMIIDLEQATAYFLNPQYYAIKDLMDMVK